MWDDELVDGVAAYLEAQIAGPLEGRGRYDRVAVHREYVDPYHLDYVPALVLQLGTYEYRAIDQITSEQRYVLAIFGAGRPEGGQREAQILASAVNEVCVADGTLGGVVLQTAVTEREYYPSSGGTGSDMPVFRLEMVVICAQSG